GLARGATGLDRVAADGAEGQRGDIPDVRVVVHEQDSLQAPLPHVASRPPVEKGVITNHFARTRLEGLPPGLEISDHGPGSPCWPSGGRRRAPPRSEGPRPRLPRPPNASA